jgi:nucleoside-diphosphate-sugar epimerase
MASVLVTGGGGFIGSHITTRMVESGHRVRVMDNFSSGHRRNLAHLGDKVEVFESDIRKPDDCDRACAGVEFIFHQAAVPSVPLSVDKPLPSHEANINGTFNLLRAAARHKVHRFIYAASSSAYGETKESPKHEGIVPMPLSPYAVQKLTGEHYCRAFTECYGLETLAIRYFNVFGERQDPKSQYAAAIPAFVTSILRGESPIVYGDGEQTRDFTYIDNVVHGNVLAMKAEKTSGEAVNVACGGQVTVSAVIAAINSALGRNVPTRHVEQRPGDVRHSCADISLARKLLGYEPLVDFEEGLRRAIEYYKTLA